MSLDDDDISTLFKDDFQDKPLNPLVLSGDVALVLARANSSALLSNIRHQQSYSFGGIFFEQFLSPWYRKHQEFLNQEGFYMEFIHHDVNLADCPCCCVVDGVPCRRQDRLALEATGAALVKIALVDKVFAIP
jgi:hypothetical protein